MAKTIELFTNMATEVTREKMGREPKHDAHVLVEPEEIADARRLATDKFANLGKIRKEEIGEDGLLAFDPYLKKSTFFGVYDTANSSLEAASRIIWSEDTTVDDMRLPTEKIDEEYAKMLHSLEPGKVAEIGSLAKRDKNVPTIATLKLLREIFAFAQDKGIEKFVCGLEPKLYPTYKRMFGGALERMTEEDTEFPGIEGMQVPLVIDIESALSYDFEKMQARTLGEKATGIAMRGFFNSAQTSRE